MKFKAWQADLALLLVAAIWGSTFIIVKEATADMPTFTFLAVRFSIAALSLAVLRPSLTFWRDKQMWKAGFLIGTLLFGGYAFQTMGLQFTSAAKTGFITGLSVVFVPLIVAIVDKRLPGRKTTVGIIVATIGLALLSLNGFNIALGDFLVFLCAICFALHIYTVAQFSKSYDAIAITVIQLLTVAVLSSVAMLVFEINAPVVWSNNVWWALVITAVPATSLAFLAQNGLQRYTTPTHTALIFSSEPVFSFIFAFIIAGEVLTLRGGIGALLILSGVILSQTE